MSKKIIINEKQYEIIENFRDCYNKEEVESKCTEYFDDYDYILGDYAYDVLRLKGFCEKENKLYKSCNDIRSYKEYIDTNCAYGCRYFLIKKSK